MIKKIKVLRVFRRYETANRNCTSPIGDPKILIVDEPTAGLDPGERNRFYDLLSDVGKDVLVILSPISLMMSENCVPRWLLWIWAKLCLKVNLKMVSMNLMAKFLKNTLKKLSSISTKKNSMSFQMTNWRESCNSCIGRKSR